MAIKKLSMAKKSFVAVKGETYYLVDAKGNPLKQIHTKINNNKLEIFENAADQEPALVVDNYQEANFISPRSTQVTGDTTVVQPATSSEEAMLAQEISQSSDRDNTLLWIGGGVLAAGGLAALLIGGGDGDNPPATTPPVNPPAGGDNPPPPPPPADTTTDKPTVTVASVATLGVENGKIANNQVISSTQASGNDVAVVVNLSGLETNGSATVKVTIGNNTYSQTATANGAVTVTVPRSALASGNSLSVVAEATDGKNNPKVSSDPFNVAYQTDFVIGTPTVAIANIGNGATYQLDQSQLDTAIPVKVSVANIDADATAVLVLKVGTTVISTQTVSNGDVLLSVTGNQLRSGTKLTAELTATDANTNSVKVSNELAYNVENFIKIQQIDSDFNISLTDNRHEGVLISGTIDLTAEYQQGYLTSQYYEGDIWRWIDAVTIEFANGKSYSVPVQHADSDNNVYTADANQLTYSLALTPTQWKEVENQKFRILGQRLVDNEAKVIPPLVYNSTVNEIQSVIDGNGQSIPALKATEKLKSVVDIQDSGDTTYPHLLVARHPKTWIKGIAGGTDVKAGDDVIISVGGETKKTKLDANKEFALELDTHILLTAASTRVSAKLSTSTGKTLSDNESYVSSSHSGNGYQASGSVENVNAVETKALADLPYFISALLWEGDNIYKGYLSAPRTTKAVEIKYYLDGFTAENKTIVKEALAKFEAVSQVKFVESATAFANKADGLTFHMTQTKADGSAWGNVLGYASYGGDVYLNAPNFQTGNGSNAAIAPKNQGYTTVLHETMHALGFKHPFIDNDSGHEHTEAAATTGTNANGQKEYIVNQMEDRSMLTIMSYNNDIHGYGSDLRIFDLAALHYRYGVNANVRPEDNTYTFKNFNEEAADGDIYIWDGAGNDTFNAKNEAQGVTINLTPGSWIYSGAKTERLAIDQLSNLTEQDFFNNQSLTATDNYLKYVFNSLYPSYTMTKGQAFIGFSTSIENAVGSDFDDTLIGNKADNLLEGGKGNDRLVGAEGNDVLNGGEGADTMEGGVGKDIYYVDNIADNIIEGDITNYDAKGVVVHDIVYSTVDYKVHNGVDEVHLLGSDNLNINARDYRTSDPNLTLLGNEGNNIIETSQHIQTRVELRNSASLDTGADTIVLNLNKLYILSASYGAAIFGFDSDDKIRLDSKVFTNLTKDNYQTYLKVDDSGDSTSTYKLKYSEDGQNFNYNLADIKYNAESIAKFDLATQIEIV